MKIVILLVIIGCLFGGGYILSKKIDLFFTRNQLKATGKAIKESQLWIGVTISDWTLPWMIVEYLMTKDTPRVRTRIGSESWLMHRLAKNEVDFLVLRKQPTKEMFEGVRYIRVDRNELYERGRNKDSRAAWIVWNEKVKSYHRNNLLSIFEDKQSILKTGYCNY